MKIKSASLFGLTLALAVIAFAAPAQARDNNGYGNYLSSGINNNSGGGCDRGNGRGNDHNGGHHRRGQRAFGSQYQNQFGNQNQFQNQSQVGIFPNAPFAGNTAYGYNQNLGYNAFANSPTFLNERARLQQQLSYGNLSARDRDKLLNRLAKLEAKAFNQNTGILSNLRNQYLNNGTFNNGNFNTGINSGFLNNSSSLANAGYVNQVRGMLGF
jgi:hypothetical protein